jgi:tetratricopeptide (TPR) repeat protein/DNA-binding CsgD family transcriptional regulator
MKHSLRVLAIVILVNAASFAQNQKELDSLYTLLPLAKDTNKVKILWRLSRLELYTGKVDTSLLLLRQALREAQRLNYHRGVVQSYRNLAYTYHLNFNEFDRPLLFLDSAEAWVNTPAQAGMIYSTRGLIYVRKGEFEKSHRYFIRALELAPNATPSEMYQIHSMMGYALNNLGRRHEAIQFHKKSLRIAEEKLGNREIGAALANLGGPYVQLEEYDSALRVFRKLYKFELAHGNPLLNPTLLSELGKIYYHTGALDSAYYFMHTGLKAAFTLNLPYAISQNLSTLGHYHLKLHPDSALFYGKRLLKNVNRNSALDMDNVTFILAEAYGKLKRYDSSYHYYNQYQLYHDSVFQEKQTEQIAELEAQFNLKQKQQEIVRLEAARQNEILKRNGLAIGLGLTLIIGMLMYFYLRSLARARKREIELQHWQLENFMRQMVEKSALVEELRAQLEQFRSEIVIPQEKLENLSQILNSSILTNDDWEQFKALFEQVHRNFFAELKIKYPTLTQAETRLAALLRLNVTTREMANMLGISVDSANKARYRLRKKLGLQPEQDLQEIFGDTSASSPND